MTLSPVMGDYLNMVNNDKPSATVQPNENYARELLQLFSIGVWDAEPGRHADARRVRARRSRPTTRTTIEGFAHVFTGWTYPPLPGRAAAHAQPEELSWPT